METSQLLAVGGVCPGNRGLRDTEAYGRPELMYELLANDK